MADIAPTPSLPTQQQSYRPIGGLAIAGFALALLSGMVFLFDSHWLVVILPLPALILSAIARRRIRQSEGTMAGYNLAGLGAALSTVILLVYLTVNTTQHWILRSESKEFVDRWLEKMRDGKEGLAFLDSVPAEQRHVNFPLTDSRQLRARFPSPANPDESLYDFFRQSQLSGALLRYKDRVEWKYVKLEEMKYNMGSYTVKHRYWLKTPEAAGEVIFGLTSAVTQSASGPRRDWKMELSLCAPAPGQTAVLTPHGERLHDMQREAGKGLRLWLTLIALGRKAEAEKLLDVAGDRNVKAEFDRLYESLRRGVKPEERAKITPKDRATVLLEDTNEGKNWTLDYEGVIDTENREVEVRFRVETDDPEKGPEGWRISRVKFMGEHKKVISEQEMTGAGRRGG